MTQTDSKNESELNILGLGGRLRPGSYTQLALEYALQQAQAPGVNTQMWSQQQLRLPLCDGGETSNEVAALQAAVEHADALVLATPEYCGTVSACMKNLIEWIGYERLVQKPVGLIAVAAGSSADGSLNALRQLALVQGMWIIPAAAPVPLAERVFTQQDSDEFSQLVLHHLKSLGNAIPEAIRRLNTPSANFEAHQ